MLSSRRQERAQRLSGAVGRQAVATATDRARSSLSSLAQFLVRDSPDRLYLLLVVAVGAYVFYTGLGGYPIRNWDEAMYANAARNMLSGHPLVPHLHWMYGPDAGFRPHLEKPPLVMWLQAAAMLVFGATEFAVRLPGATASVLTGVLVYVAGRDAFDRLAGLFGALAFYTTPMAYVGFNAGRTGGLDAPLVLFGSLFVYQTYRVATGRSDGYTLLGVFAGLAVLAKGFAAGVFVVAALPLVAGHRERFLRRRFGRTLAATGLLVLPWTLYAWLRYGDLLVRELLVDQVLARAGGRFAVSGGVFGFQNFPYLRNQLVAFDPWVFLFAPALVAVAVQARRERSIPRFRAFLVWWVAAVFLVYLPTGNHAWYVLPAYVPATLLLGSVLSDATTGDRAAVTATALGLVTAVLCSVRMGDVGPQWARAAAFEFGFAGPYVSGLPYALALAVVGAGVVTASDLDGAAAWLLGPWADRLRPVALVAGVAALVFGLVLVPPDTAEFDGGWSADQQDLGEELRSTVPVDGVVYFTPETVTSTSADDALHTVPFYARRSFAPASLDTLESDESRRYALLREDQVLTIDRGYTAIQHISVRNRGIVFIELRSEVRTIGPGESVTLLLSPWPSRH